MYFSQFQLSNST
ncbi:Protein of unknown function [Bacillus mycoides]|nr:Protein of unknown function [Bacillus mycoides]